MHKVVENSEVPFTLHDLRRTFITIAKSLDISVYSLKCLPNYKMQNDITVGYVVLDTERLRKFIQMITDYLLKAMGVKPIGEALDIKTGKKLNNHG